MGITVPLNKNFNLQVPGSKMRSWPGYNALFECVPNRSEKHANYFLRCIIWALCMFFKRCGLVLDENKGIINCCGVKYYMRSQYLVWMPLGHQSAIRNDMQVHMSIYADTSPYYHSSSSAIHEGEGWRSVGLFRLFLFLRTKTRQMSHSAWMGTLL